MLTNRILRIQRLSTKIREYSSHAQATYPFTKLRAYPFRISPEDAIVQIAPYASYVCMFQQFLGSLGARFLPGFGFEPLRPVRITPVYFPGWFIDAEVSADFNLKNVLSRGSGITQASYLPGSDFRVLSWVSYRFDGGPDPVPFTEELTRQHGVDVTCIPYTISPFAAFDFVQSVTDPVQLHENVSFVPSSIHTGMFAAYPVLFPLYLAQYEYPFPGNERLVTFFLEAATLNGRIQTEKIVSGEVLRDRFTRDNFPQYFIDLTHKLDDMDVPCMRGRPDYFFRFDGFKFLQQRQIAPMMDCWLNDAVATSGVGQELAKRSGILTSDADPRIRPFTVEERKAVQSWLALSEKIESLTRILESLQKTLVTQLVRDKRDNAIKSLEHKIAELKAKQNAVTPQWWEEWRHISQ
ncbi:hypothetical protein E4T56_gene3323 [Termitomyces sp. T112]|nr:hypothetical protein E4T56_gene3323 [Termitomyces sp. T112]KAH0585114.1 hypothetical protein H2248_008375 [Termitomyces sp. 'cryptogamus']KNZ81912.1 hypothetical protein J132_10191 [Termitomyces sp. J132]